LNPISVEASLFCDRAKLDQMAERFFGYGNWRAPFWFIGPEAGMATSGDTLELRYESWKALNFDSVVDCAAHHRGFNFTKWHRYVPPTQATWRQLIRLLLAFKDQSSEAELEAIRSYQLDHWGSCNGETCVIELSGLASPNMRASRDRTTFLARRIARIREEILTHEPKIVVMYGWDKLNSGNRFPEQFSTQME
jgi:hypothetical protein